MRRRPGGAIRILDRCARCGRSAPYGYQGRRVNVHLQTGTGLQRHELFVCTSCESASAPTVMEQAAMSIDATDPVRSMEFAERWHGDAARVQRTAEYFLGTEAYAARRAELVAERRILEERYAAMPRYHYSLDLEDPEEGWV